MKRFARTIQIACISLVMQQAAAAQELAIPEVVYPKLLAQAGSGSDFVPKGWKLEHEVTGDLNQDGLLDLFLVLKDDDPKNIVSDPGFSENPVNTNPRILAVAFREKASMTYRLIFENHVFVPRITEPVFDDYLDEGGVTIERGSINISLFSFGSDIRRPAYQFRYQNDRFELIGYSDTVVRRSTGELTTTSVNFVTREVETTIGTIENDTVQTKTSKLKPGPAITMDSIGESFRFDPREHFRF